MKYIDIEKLRALGRDEFMAARPWPHFSTQGLLTAQGYEDLLHNLPPLSSFEGVFGKQRRAGQTPHDRHSLEYTPQTDVPRPWKEFIAELCGDDYRREIARLLGARKVEFRFHWHYTPAGCSVSPHCDARREHGSHLFYFNAEDEWKPEWGGGTLLLDDGGRFSHDSAPGLDEFDGVVEAECIGNHSSLLMRSDRSWHAVRTIQCPEGRLRKVFIVVVNPSSLFWRVRDWVVGKEVERF